MGSARLPCTRDRLGGAQSCAASKALLPEGRPLPPCRSQSDSLCPAGPTPRTARVDGLPSTPTLSVWLGDPLFKMTPVVELMAENVTGLVPRGPRGHRGSREVTLRL